MLAYCNHVLSDYSQGVVYIDNFDKDFAVAYYTQKMITKMSLM